MAAVALDIIKPIRVEDGFQVVVTPKFYELPFDYKERVILAAARACAGGHGLVALDVIDAYSGQKVGSVGARGFRMAR
jgi:hypothetical protein